MVDAYPDCLELLDLDGRLVFLDAYALRSLSASQPGRLLGSHWPRLQEGRPEALEARAALTAARDGRASRFKAPWTTPEGLQRWWEVSVAPVPGEDGEPERVLVISHDITDEERSKAQTVLMMRELQHRVRNAFATAGAIATQTLREESSTAAAKQCLQQRLAAVSRAHQMLADSDWSGADMASLVGSVLAVHERPHLPGRFLIDGPRLYLNAQAATALSLLIHELATNALRHGALSAAEGRVSVIWQIGPDGRFQLDWCEAGGPAVRPPSRRGFGSRLIEHSVPDQFGGVGRLEFPLDGLRYSLTAQQDRLAAAA